MKSCMCAILVVLLSSACLPGNPRSGDASTDGGASYDVSWDSSSGDETTYVDTYTVEAESGPTTCPYVVDWVFEYCASDGMCVPACQYFQDFGWEDEWSCEGEPDPPDPSLCENQ
jgi:hypothetical protein